MACRSARRSEIRSERFPSGIRKIVFTREPKDTSSQTSTLFRRTTRAHTHTARVSSPTYKIARAAFKHIFTIFVYGARRYRTGFPIVSINRLRFWCAFCRFARARVPRSVGFYSLPGPAAVTTKMAVRVSGSPSFHAFVLKRPVSEFYYFSVFFLHAHTAFTINGWRAAERELPLTGILEGTVAAVARAFVYYGACVRHVRVTPSRCSY